jgi:molybdopterin/thiamine biosynthesis adenylyltransferase
MDFWRQLGIVSPEDLASLRVTVIGCGGIGSLTTLALAKMGVSQIVVYDDDSVEPHNLPNQMYRLGDLGKAKVEALAEICRDYAGVAVEIKKESFDGSQQLAGVIILGVDSMSARKQIWSRVKYNPAIQIYIEARMGAEVARVYTIHPCDPDDVKFYESMLYEDGEASELPCTARAVMYNTLAVAGLVANQVKKFARAEPLAREIIFDLKTLTLLVNK